MKHVLGPWWTARSAQERRLLVIAALCLGVLLYAWLLQATAQARQRLLPAVAELRVAAAQQGAQADEIVRLRATPPPPPSTMDLRQLVQRQIDASNLGGSLVSLELVGTQQAKVVFGSVGIADWLRWADTMQAQHLRFSAARIEAQPAPGQVSVTATLDRPSP